MYHVQWISHCTQWVTSSTFVIFADCELPGELVSLVRLLLQSAADWAKTQSKGKLPKPTADADILDVAVEVLENRLTEYPTTVEVCPVS